jgi:hypothetical protein
MSRKHRIFFFIFFAVIILVGAGYFYLREQYFNSNWEIEDPFDGNIFPSVILSTATTPELLIQSPDTNFVGNARSFFAIRVKSQPDNAHIIIKIPESPFFEATETEVVLPRKNVSYLIYPDMVFKYEALKSNTQSVPLDITVQLSLNGRNLGKKHKTFSVRSINECLLGYFDQRKKFHPTGIFFAAYVNEEHPMIDRILREALDTRIVRRFEGYQSRNPEQVKKQVYAIWSALQKRDFKYSSIVNTSMPSSNVYTQRVRTLDDAFASSQINCVDGSVLFASLLRAINIEPILVRMPGHMFVGFYLDKKRTERAFLETTMIGDVDLEEYFTETQIDSLEVMSQNQVSLITFEKAMDYANNKFEQKKDSFLTSKNPNFMYLEIGKELRRRVQPIGK